jgi:hydrogenase maturation protease
MIVLIGYGNPLRRDDGTGPALARMIGARCGPAGLRVLTPHQLVPELAECLAEKDVTAVLFLDACVSESERNRKVTARPVEGAAPSPAFGHHFPPAALLLYTELLRGSPLPAWEVSIPGVDFGFGEGLSRQAEENLVAAYELLENILQILPRR